MKLAELWASPKYGKVITRKILLIITFTILLIFGLFNTQTLLNVFFTILNAATPFLSGIFVAYILNVIVKAFEEHVFSFLNRKAYKWWIRIRRPFCIFLSILVLAGLFTMFLWFIVPELIHSLSTLADHVPGYVASITKWVNETLAYYNITSEQINFLQIDWSSLITQATQITSDFLGNIYNMTVSVASVLFTFSMSMIFSFYMLGRKERLMRGMRSILYGFLPAHRARRIIELSAISNRIFSSFVAGQMTESLIIGFLFYIGTTALQLPYAMLISCFVGMLSLIPMVGFYVGVAIGCIILVMVNPIYVVYFIIFTLIEQQVEGNLIYPRVVGTSIGLPGIWVLFSVLVFGGLFGIMGILLGIPSMSVVYTLFNQNLTNRLKARHITDDVVNEPVDVDSLLKKDTGSPLKKLSLHLRRKRLHRAKQQEARTREAEKQMEELDHKAQQESEAAQEGPPETDKEE